MTVLGALADYYDRLADRGEVPPYGYSFERISFELVLSLDGTLVVIQDLRDRSGRKPQPRHLAVPTDPRTTRTSAILPKFLWDKTAYVLGITAGTSRRTAQEHAAFRALHEDLLGEVDDEEPAAVLAFLRSWRPERFPALARGQDAIDTNVVFRIDGRLHHVHETEAIKAIWTRRLAEGTAREGICLATGTTGAIARLHPPIRGVYGAQSSGAYIVSYNIDAFDSYLKEGGANAPVSEQAAFAYTSALNRLLMQGSRNRLQIGDASTVFWAETPEAEAIARGLFDPPPPDAEGEAAKVRDVLERIAAGRPLREAAPEVAEDTRYYVLGLAPNAARIAIRFWHRGTLGGLAERFREHWRDLAIEPQPWRTAPAIWRLLYETALQRKAENIPPKLGGDLMRAILGGQRYPRTLLGAVIMRLRADRDERDPRTGRVRALAGNGMRAAICKACIVRDLRLQNPTIREDHLVSLDTAEPNPAYRLGRLFAVLESVQRAALGNVNATIRDRYYGAASATPGSVFPMLIRNSKNHAKNVRTKRGEGLAAWYDKRIGEILDAFPPHFPRSFALEDQGRFAIGYYHEREAIYRRKDADAPPELEDADLAIDTDDTADA